MSADFATTAAGSVWHADRGPATFSSPSLRPIAGGGPRPSTPGKEEPAMFRTLWRMLAMIAIVAALGLSAIALPAQAQEQEPSASHPAQISKGTCGNLDQTP